VYRKREPANEGSPKEFDYDREVFERMSPVAHRPETDEAELFEQELRYDLRNNDER
jgi:hypothetical protein